MSRSSLVGLLVLSISCCPLHNPDAGFILSHSSLSQVVSPSRRSLTCILGRSETLKGRTTGPARTREMCRWACAPATSL